MSSPLRRPIRLGAIGITIVAGALALAACSSPQQADVASESTESSPSESAAQAWPRTFINADGTTTEIAAQPERIVSTSVTATGTLLAIDAPVVASGGAAGGKFFAQWADVAAEREVESLWEVGSFDPEALIAADPDLIVVVTSGRESLMNNLEAIKPIAPTIVVDYGSKTWQDLAIELGHATGHEQAAESTIAEFDAAVTKTAEEITIPEGTANIIAFNGPGQENPVGRKGGAQAQLLASLGFAIEDPDPSWHTQANDRGDFVWTSYEKLPELTSATTFVLSADHDKAQEFAKDPVMANVASVKAGRVYGLGENSFRMDRYSATEIVEMVRTTFGGETPQAS